MSFIKASNSPKYGFVFGSAHKDIITQIIAATITGDLVLASAYAHELPLYGLEVGLTNYAAAYCTDLLLARRVLKKLEMDAEYEGNVEATGEDYSVEPGEVRQKGLLDVGLVRNTTGNRVFGAFEGALDGGLDVPYSKKRFAGFPKGSDAETHRKYIYGGHVAALTEDEPGFSRYIKKGVEADAIEDMRSLSGGYRQLPGGGNKGHGIIGRLASAISILPLVTGMALNDIAEMEEEMIEIENMNLSPMDYPHPTLENESFLLFCVNNGAGLQVFYRLTITPDNIHPVMHAVPLIRFDTLDMDGDVQLKADCT